MIYFVDTNCFRILEGYYPSRFPSFWSRFNEAAEDGQIASVEEVRKELELGNTAQHIEDWIQSHKEFFRMPDENVLEVLPLIFSKRHFQSLVGPRQILAGQPVADPFLIAAAKAANGCVVTEERHKPNSAKIPTVCDYFQVKCTNLEGMLDELGWEF